MMWSQLVGFTYLFAPLVFAAVPPEWQEDAARQSLLFAENDLLIPPAQMPAVGNGYLATQIGSGQLMVAGLQNGRAGDGGKSSHRAAIPCDFCALVSPGYSSHASLDLENAVYRRRAFVEPESKGHRQIYTCNREIVGTKAQSLMPRLGPVDGRGGEWTTWTAGCSRVQAKKLWFEQRFYAHRELKNVFVHELAVLGPEGLGPTAGSPSSAERDWKAKVGPPIYRTVLTSLADPWRVRLFKLLMQDKPRRRITTMASLLLGNVAGQIAASLFGSGSPGSADSSSAFVNLDEVLLLGREMMLSLDDHNEDDKGKPTGLAFVTSEREAANSVHAMYRFLRAVLLGIWSTDSLRQQLPPTIGGKTVAAANIVAEGGVASEQLLEQLPATAEELRRVFKAADRDPLASVPLDFSAADAVFHELLAVRQDFAGNSAPASSSNSFGSAGGAAPAGIVTLASAVRPGAGVVPKTSGPPSEGSPRLAGLGNSMAWTSALQDDFDEQQEFDDAAATDSFQPLERLLSTHRFESMAKAAVTMLADEAEAARWLFLDDRRNAVSIMMASAVVLSKAPKAPKAPKNASRGSAPPGTFPPLMPVFERPETSTPRKVLVPLAAQAILEQSRLAASSGFDAQDFWSQLEERAKLRDIDELKARVSEGKGPFRYAYAFDEAFFRSVLDNPFIFPRIEDLVSVRVLKTKESEHADVPPLQVVTVSTALPGKKTPRVSFDPYRPQSTAMLSGDKASAQFYSHGAATNGTAFGMLHLASAGSVYPFFTVVKTSLDVPKGVSASDAARWLINSACEDFATALDLAASGTLYRRHVEAWRDQVTEKGGAEVEASPSSFASAPHRQSGLLSPRLQDAVKRELAATPSRAGQSQETFIPLLQSPTSATVLATSIAAVFNASLFSLSSYQRRGWPFGSSPGGLSTSGYGGRVFWDYDSFSFPSLLLLNPGIAASSIDFRLRGLPGARAKASAGGGRYAGASWPWETGPVTGSEAVPRWASVMANEIHIGGDIAASVFQTLATMSAKGLKDGDSKTRRWVKEVAFPLLAETADFWLSRAVVDTASMQRKPETIQIPEWNDDRANVLLASGAADNASSLLSAAMHAAAALCAASGPEGAGLPFAAKTRGRHHYLCRASLGALRLARKRAQETPLPAACEAKATKSESLASSHRCVAALLADVGGKGTQTETLPLSPSSSSPLHITAVVAPTEHYRDKTDQVFTNAGAKLALLHAAHTARDILGLPREVWLPWEEAGRRIAVLFDQSKGIHPYFEGFNFASDLVQCLDVPMLQWPLGLTDTAPTYLFRPSRAAPAAGNDSAPRPSSSSSSSSISATTVITDDSFHHSPLTFLKDLDWYSQHQDAPGSVAFAWALNSLLEGIAGAVEVDELAKKEPVASSLGAKQAPPIEQAFKAYHGIAKRAAQGPSSFGEARVALHSYRSAHHLNRAFTSFVHGPFKIWQEYSGGGGISNFVTGAGAILETLLYGYARASFLYEPYSGFHGLGLRPSLLPGSRRVSTRLSYAGNALKVSWDADKLTLTRKCPSSAAKSKASSSPNALLSSLWSPAVDFAYSDDPRSPVSTIAAVFEGKPWLSAAEQVEREAAFEEVADLEVSAVFGMHLSSLMRDGAPSVASSPLLLFPWADLRCGPEHQQTLPLSLSALLKTRPAPLMKLLASDPDLTAELERGQDPDDGLAGVPAVVVVVKQKM